MAGGTFSTGRAASGRRVYRPMAEINVTPFVDVMLVLLIIFMIAAPLMTVGVQVDLPRTAAAPLTQPQEPLVVSVDAEGRIWLQETQVQLEELVPRLSAIVGSNPDARVFVRGDRAISYGRVMEVMGTVSAAGIAKVALLAEQPQPGSPGAGAPPRAPAPPGRGATAPAAPAVPAPPPAPPPTPRR
ncbi:MAG: protein TolR [Alphaproteobacteria bacterium]|nr:protein TolR [Alphaproteobacteria bacterium]